VFKAINEVEFGEIDVADPGPGEVQVRTLASLISTGTERWILRNEFTWYPTPYPVVPGYQRAGIVVKVGEGVDGIRAGERVMATRSVWQGDIRPFNGAHAALANTKAEELFKLPESVKDADAAGLVVAQVGYNAASRIAMKPGDWVVVYGDGLIGQCGLQAAKARGARTILVGRRGERLAAAEGFADHIVNSRSENVTEAVLGITGGKPVTAVIDTLQTEEVQATYMPLMEKGEGQVVYSGFTPGKVWADMAQLQQKEFTAHFVSGWNRSRMEATLRLMAEGKMSIERLITHRGPAREGPKFYAMASENKEPFLGILLEWGAEP